VTDASTFAGAYGGYAWLLVVLLVGAAVAVLRRLIRLALMLGLVVLVVLLWRSSGLPA